MSQRPPRLRKIDLTRAISAARAINPNVASMAIEPNGQIIVTLLPGRPRGPAQREPCESSPKKRRRSRKRMKGAYPIAYFIKCGEFVKIGKSGNPSERLLTLRTGNPFDLELLHFVEGHQWLESQFHQRFSDYRHRDEWFRLEGELKAWLEIETGKMLGGGGD